MKVNQLIKEKRLAFCSWSTPIHDYSEVYLTEFNGVYSQVSVYRKLKELRLFFTETAEFYYLQKTVGMSPSV